MSEEIDDLLAAVKRYGDVMGQLRAAGVEPDPNAQMVPLGSPPALARVVVVDRVADNPNPTYCVHGYAACTACGKVVLLGNNTLAEIAGGRAWPLCMVCARDMPTMKRAGHVGDAFKGLPHA